MAFIDKLFDNYEFKNIAGLTSELKGVYTYNYFKLKNHGLIYLTNSLYEANKMYQIISNYTDKVLLFPMDDFLTSEALAISPEFEITRLETLNSLIEDNNQIVITNLMGFLRYLPEKNNYVDNYINIKKNMDYDMKQLISDLYKIGYDTETIVTKTGDMALRGYVIDIFPITFKNPIRLEFWGDTIDSIRIFDTDTQKTIDVIDEIIIKPNTEFITDNEIEERKQRELIKYEKVANISNYIDNVTIFYDDYSDIKNGYNILLDEIFDYNVNQYDGNQIKYMFSLEEVDNIDSIFYTKYDNLIDNVESTINYNAYEIEAFSKNINDINKRFEYYLNNKKTVIVCLSNRYQINKIIDNIDNENIVVTNENEIYDNKINLIIKNIRNGYIFNDYIVVSEYEFFNKKQVTTRYKSNFKYGSKIKDLTKLNVGDYIVHTIYGIGRYVGLKTLNKNKILKDYLTIEYKGGDKLYIPVEKIDLISKYSSNENIVPKINKLGSSEWAKTKLRVQKKIESIAGELLELYAAREASKGFAFIKDDKNQFDFENDFGYEDTVDQHRASEQIKRDMESSHPMDRLLCGDVGYGKTEVAFRAMYKAVLSKKQVAYLCPTTILSNQHYQNALKRFQNTGVEIALLNRFVSSKDLKRIISDLEEGKIDILIGTHRILSNDIKFKDLGLLVIDEEQRFGVKHKEKIKSFKNNIDVLTLSATPIPRTLQMSMAGIRSLSLIETPPVNRYPVQTYVLEENGTIIKDAIYKELSRNGQAFILFNSVEHIEAKKREIERLIPDAKVVCAHGQMSKKELEDIMFKFSNKEYDILICTTIIETGIDMPNVNTLIILDADYFGLSQLYQIRGRVGRSDRIAYCYLMYKVGKSLSDVASKRLNVIKEFTELGSGFSIAMRDLSIRGAGDILGSEQAGFIDSVGIELYLNMLNDEVNKLKGIKPKEEIKDDQPLINVETTINDNYVADIDLKIEIHKAINSIDSYEKLESVKNDIEDRFGKISENLLIYMHEEWFEKLAKNLNIKQVRQTDNFIEITLPKEITEKIDGDKLFTSVNDISRKFRFSMRLNNLIITLDLINLDEHFIYYLIKLLEIVKNSI